MQIHNVKKIIADFMILLNQLALITNDNLKCNYFEHHLHKTQGRTIPQIEATYICKNYEPKDNATID